MVCPKCNTENHFSRRFCKECGSTIISFCQICGFGNFLTDKFCGGCGRDLINHDNQKFQGESTSFNYQNFASGGFSKYDISELMQSQQPEVETQGRTSINKKLNKNDTVSQDILDSIFDSSDSD